MADHVTMISSGSIVLSGPLAALKEANRAGDRLPSLDEIFIAHVGNQPGPTQPV